MELDALLGRAERVVEVARSRGLAHVEAYVESSEGLSIEIEKGTLSTTSSSRSTGGAVRVVQDGRLGFAYFTEDADAGRALDAALANTRLATVPGYALPRGDKPRAMPGRWHPAVADAGAAAAVELAQAVLAGAAEAAPKAVVSGGGVSLDAGGWALASTEGTACADRATLASASAGLVLEDGDRSISTSESQGTHGLGLDGAGVGRIAGETAMSLRQPKDLPSGGRRDVVLRPETAAELLADWMVSAATGDEALRGKTAWSGRLGSQVAAAGLSLVDDPWLAGALGSAPVDGEGLPAARLPIVEAGVLRSFLFDSWDAHRNRATGTHSAVRDDFKGRPSTGTHHLVVSHATTRPMPSLVADIDDGLLVESVLGAHTANATTGDFSVTAPNVWRIRRGAIEGPVRDVALAGLLPDLLQRLDAVSSETKPMTGLRMPSVRLRGVDVSV